MTPPVASPIVVVRGGDCAFYRDVPGLAAAPIDEAKVFDGLGRRMAVTRQGWLLASTPDDADELAALLRAWLGRMDALRESTANWSLDLLIKASVDHLGFS